MNSSRYAIRWWISEFRDPATENEFRRTRCDTDKSSGLLYLTIAGLAFLAFHSIDRRNFLGSDGGEIEVLLALRLLPIIAVGIVGGLIWRSRQPKVVTAGIAIAVIALSGAYLAVSVYTHTHGAISVLHVFFPFVCFFCVLISPSSVRASVVFGLLVVLFAVPGALMIGMTEAQVLRMAFHLMVALTGGMIIVVVAQRNHRRLYADLRHAEDRRRHVAQKLNEAERFGSIGMLMATVVHDLNNYLTPVLGMTELLQANLEHDKPQQALARQAHEAAVRATEVARRLLDDARGEPARTRVRVRDAVRMLHETLQDAVGSRTLDLELPDANFYLRAEPQAFERVLLNLVVNAGEAVAEEGGKVEVRFESTGDADDPVPCVRMRVRDNGGGIHPAVRECLFDPLVTTKATGHGLGLATVKQIVEDHNGSIDARNLEQGAVFEVSWPLAPDDSGEAAVSAP